MPSAEARIRMIVGACCTVVFIILIIVGVSTDHWTKLSNSSGTLDSHLGLWSVCNANGICNSISRDTSCSDQFDSSLCERFNTARAFGLLCILVAAGTIISTMTALSANKGSRIAVLVLTSVTLSFGLVASAVYGSFQSSLSDASPGVDVTSSWSFGLFVLGWIVFSVGGYLAGSAEAYDPLSQMRSQATAANAAPGTSVLNAEGHPVPVVMAEVVPGGTTTDATQSAMPQNELR